jgi:hypothetical protein
MFDGLIKKVFENMRGDFLALKQMLSVSVEASRDQIYMTFSLDLNRPIAADWRKHIQFVDKVCNTPADQTLEVILETRADLTEVVEAQT